MESTKPGTARRLLVLALIGAAVFIVLPAGATTHTRMRWHYHVVLDEGHSTLHWKVTSGTYAGSNGTTLTQYTQYKRRGSGDLYVYGAKGGAKSGAGASQSTVDAKDTYSATTCYEGPPCEATCTDKIDKQRLHQGTDWKIVQKGKAVRIVWHVAVAVELCTWDSLFDGVRGTKPTTVPFAFFAAHALVFPLESHGERTFSQYGAVGTLRWSWRMKLVRKPT